METHPADVLSDRMPFIGGDVDDEQECVEKTMPILESAEALGRTRLTAGLVPLRGPALESATDEVVILSFPASALPSDAQISARLSELAVLKADFTAMVAHELSSPLAAVRALVSMVASGKLDPQRQAEALTTIRAEIDVLSKLVADVRSASSIERADFGVQLRPVAVRALIAGAAAFAGTLPGDHQLSTRVGADVMVLADPERIGQVLRNLLSNAAKYSPEGAPIELRATTGSGRVRFEVVDGGYGIHPDDLGRIFEKFGRGRDRSGHKVEGVGLGLYLSRRIVQAHGSDLEVESTPEHGSVFAFELEVVV